MNILEIIGTAIGLIYLYLEFKASIWLWAAGIIMPAVYVVIYWKAGLYADCGISVYYLLASAYGIACWLGHKKDSRQEKAEMPAAIRRLPSDIYPCLAAALAVLTAVIAAILILFTDSNVVAADSFSTALSIIAMWMLAKKYAEQWLAWITVDIVSSVLYVYKGLPFTACLYALYAIIAVFGFRKWLQMSRRDANDLS